MKNFFYPIDGGDDIGASSYYLEVDGVRILFDCGSRKYGIEKYPKYEKLYKFLNSLDEIDCIILSHAHFDHIGSYNSLINKIGKRTKVLATKTTKEITKLQYLELNRAFSKKDSSRIKEIKRIKLEGAIDRINDVPILEAKKFDKYKITLIPSGHMLGATMAYIETRNNKVLYTGDFSFNSMNDINEIKIEGLNPNILVLNATQGYRKYVKSKNYISLVEKIKDKINNSKNILIKSNSIAKHLDLLYLLNNNELDVDVYLSKKSEIIANSLEDLGYKIYSKNIKCDLEPKVRPHILFGYEEKEGYEFINGDEYSLHANYEEIKGLIEKLKPEKVFVVHSKPNFTKNNIITEISEKGIDIVQCKNCNYYEF